ncbi:MAG: GxxExxY protein [Cytophagales bacterium]|nr:GxxExxY protein [Cytophagales bacterium]
MLETNEITEKIIGAAIRVHKELGPGLLESAYQECLFYELQQTGLNVEKEKSLPLVYRNVEMDCGYRIDLFVEEDVVVELKAVKQVEDIHIAQTLTYMKLTNTEIGLLINFNVTQLTKGIKRLINKYYEE